MPGIKKPVMKRSEKSDTASFASHATAELDNAPSKEHKKNSFTGEKRSASEKKEKTENRLSRAGGQPPPRSCASRFSPGAARCPARPPYRPRARA